MENLDENEETNYFAIDINGMALIQELVADGYEGLCIDNKYREQIEQQ